MSSKQLRGVNLGGWLVLERWITPGLFAGTEARDEFSFMRAPGAAEKIERHRQEFITEADFAWLAAHGIAAVRIPVGYWIFDGDGPFSACISYLDFAVRMAEKHRLKVLIDLHAAKGSQNGNDHSGRIGRADWFSSRTYRDETIKVLERLAKRYESSPAVWGIELLNEPKLGLRRYFILRRFYRRAYARLTEVARAGTVIVFSDGFLPRLFSGSLKPHKNYPVMMDVHWYQFGAVRLGSYFAKLRRKATVLKRLERHQPVLVGEWSGMLSHETLTGMSDDEKARLEQQHIEQQLEAYGTAAGWFYWTYKTEGAGTWNFRWLVENGWLHLKD